MQNSIETRGNLCTEVGPPLVWAGCSRDVVYNIIIVQGT